MSWKLNNPDPRTQVFFRMLLFFIVLAITLFFGLHPKGFHFKNNVKRLVDEPGLEFGAFGIAYTAPFVASHEGAGFSMTAVISPFKPSKKAFVHIITLHNGDDASQLVLGQWEGFLIFMKGDDYENKTRRPRITLDITRFFETDILITLCTGKQGSRVYLNGQLAGKLKSPGLTLPEGPDPSQLIMGNSVYGKHGWEGTLKAFILCRGGVSAEDAASIYQYWLKNRCLPVSKEDTLGAYGLENNGPYALDLAGMDHPLLIPDTIHPLKSGFLRAEGGEWRLTTLWDFAVNIVGFMPFGFSLCALVSRIRRRSVIRPLLMAAGAGFLLSMGIETVQIWILSRSSDLHDLLLNTTGAVLGAAILLMARAGKLRVRPKRPSESRVS